MTTRNTQRSSSRKILSSTETEGSAFRGQGLVGIILLTGHSGGTWTLQVRDPDGTWVNTDITWPSDGIQSFDSQRFFDYRLTGGTAGASAWYATGF